MKKQIRRLRLREGDILVVKDDSTMRALQRANAHTLFDVPILFAPEGIHRVNRKYLQKILDRPE